MPICWKTQILSLILVKDSMNLSNILMLSVMMSIIAVKTVRIEVAPLHISSALKQQNGINYLKENHIDYFKNAENVYKGGILKSLSSMARLIYGEYESDTIAPVIAIDLERHLYSQYSFLYEIGGLINHIVAAHPTNKDTRSFDFYNQDNHCP